MEYDDIPSFDRDFSDQVLGPRQLHIDVPKNVSRTKKFVYFRRVNLPSIDAATVVVI